MDRKSTKKLRMDRRLADRKNWISSTELEKELNALPDVSHKIAESQEEPESRIESETAHEFKPPTSGGSDLPPPSSTGA